MNYLEHADADEAQFDFCLWQYPAVKPCGGKLRSINLLAESFRDLPAYQRAMDIVLAIRRELGELRTVWGVKQAGTELSWELYFYDYERASRSRSIARILDIIHPWVSCGIRVSDSSPYFMFSIDLSPELLATGGELNELQMYIGNIGSSVSSGICYEVNREQTLLKNFYFFFDAKAEMNEIEGKLCTSAFVCESGFAIDDVLWPELRDCQVIVVANKSDRDGIYFSRINVKQFHWFIKRMRYPEHQIQFLESNMVRFDHMLFDVGFDYRLDAGRIHIVKSAYYGVF